MLVDSKTRIINRYKAACRTQFTFLTTHNTSNIYSREQPVTTTAAAIPTMTTRDSSSELDKETNERPREYETDVSNWQKKDLFKEWEQRATRAGCAADVARLGASPGIASKKAATIRHYPNNTPGSSHNPMVSTGRRRSTRQTIEDLAVFASPRVVNKKLTVAPRQPTTGQQVTAGMDTPMNSNGVPTPSQSTTEGAEHRISVGNRASGHIPISSIRDRIKAFERSSDDVAPWMVTHSQGGHPSVLGKMDTKQQPFLLQSRHNLQPTKFSSPTRQNVATSPENDKAAVVMTEESFPPPLLTEIDDDVNVEKKKVTPSSIDRDSIIKNEMEQMIQKAEDEEIEDDMDETVKNCLMQAALQSPAYSKRWYDAYSDTWIHCPTLSSIIMDFSLIELAETLYGEELPMLYSVALRAVAAELLQNEPDIPEYVYRLACEN